MTTYVLYRHATESVLIFLNFPDLAAALRVCKDWNQAVRMMAACNLEIDSLRQMDRMLSCSPAIAAASRMVLGRHISSLNIPHTSMAGHSLNSENILALASACPRLTKLRFKDVTSDEHAQWRFPPTLTFVHYIDSFEGEHRLNMDALARLPELTHLNISTDTSWHWNNLDPLVGAHALTALDLSLIQNGWNNDEVDPSRVGQVRALGHLVKMNITKISAYVMAQVLAVPHTLSWQEIGLIHDIQTANLLPALPSLTALDMTGQYLSFQILAALPRIRKLTIGRFDGRGRLASALKGCPQLEALDIYDTETSYRSQENEDDDEEEEEEEEGKECSDDMTAVLAHVPRLTSLTVRCAQSLEWVQQRHQWHNNEPNPLWNSLCKLILFQPEFDLHTPDQLRHLHNLVGMRELTFSNIGNDDIVSVTGETLLQLQLIPPSAILPSLQELTLNEVDSLRHDPPRTSIISRWS